MNQIGARITSLSGTNSYAGGTNVSAGGLTYLNTDAKPAAGNTTVAAATTLDLGVATSGSFFTAADVDSLFAGTLTGVTNDAASRVGIDTTAGNFTYGSSIPATEHGLAKLGANTLTLTGTNWYTGTILDRCFFPPATCPTPMALESSRTSWEMTPRSSAISLRHSHSCSGRWTF